jgi:hypothetical protein
MDQVVNTPCGRADLSVHTGNLFVFADVTLDDQRIVELAEDIAHEPADRLALDGERDASTSVVQILGYGPGNRVFIKHADYQRGLVGEVEKTADAVLRITHKIVLSQPVFLLPPLRGKVGMGDCHPGTFCASSSAGGSLTLPSLVAQPSWLRAGWKPAPLGERECTLEGRINELGLARSPQLPVNFGSRFSTKARTASLWSSV